MTAPDLVKRWKAIVNDHVNMGRDAYMIKEKLNYVTPVQVLVGMYSYQGVATITIPQFLKQLEDWLVEDDIWAEVELARYVTKHTPPEYHIYMDLKDVEQSHAFLQAREARSTLTEWAERTIG